MPALKTLESANEYNIGWVAALAVERAAATALLDERHDQPRNFVQRGNDSNSYTWGRISNHNVVIASLPAGGYGLINATKIALSLVSSCPHIKIGLLVGIGAGVPESGRDIRLGDVAVSRPQGSLGGVVQYDTGKAKAGSWERTGLLVPPPEVLLIALAKLEAEHELEDSQIPALLKEAGQKSPKFAQGYRHPGTKHDHLYQTVKGSDEEEEVLRELRPDMNPYIHYGTIGSGSILIKDIDTRRAISASLGPDCICLEMESAGLMNSFPCLVVRGICDYADTHKNDLWQRYASATAAAFVKELLLYLPKSDVDRARSIDKVLEKVQSGVDELNDKLRQVELMTHTERVNKLLQQLYRHPHEERKDRNPPRVTGTCNWFTNHTLFKQWLSGFTSNMLWVTADPGCGKSVLARYLIDMILPADNRSICYFFFKDDFDDQKTASGAGCTMLHQILTSNRTFITNDALKICEQYGPKLTEQFHILWKTLTYFASRIPGELVCVIDALDECRKEDRLELVQSISKYYTSALEKIKVIVLSRPYFDIERNFDQAYINGPVIRLAGENDREREEISNEIDIVLEQRINNLCMRRGLDPEDRDFLLQGFTSMPQRTYLWAHLTMAILEESPGFTRGNARRILQNIPPTVDAAYEKILRGSVDTSKTRLILQLVVAGNRAFTVAEMCILLALDGSQSRYDELEDYLEPEARFRITLREICGLFVIVVDLRVYLLHQTAREFLLRSIAETTKLASMSTIDDIKVDGIVWQHSFAETTCHRVLTERCLWLMNLGSAKKHVSDLFRYAIDTWIEHLESSNVDLEDEIFAVAETVLSASAPNLRAWFATFWARQPFQRLAVNPDTGRGDKKIITHLLNLTGEAFPLVLASILDSKILVEGLLTMFPQRWVKGGLSQALWWSLCYGTTAAAEILLEWGADANTMANGGSICRESTFASINAGTVASLRLYERPLHLAIDSAEVAMVKLLLSYGADPSISCGNDTPISAATKRRNAKITELINAHIGPPSVLDSQGHSAFHYLVKGDYHLCATDPERLFFWSPGSKYAQEDLDLALHLAVKRYCNECVALCLQQGANVQTEINGMRPLEVAMERRQFFIIHHGDHAYQSLISSLEAAKKQQAESSDLSSDSGNGKDIISLAM